MRNTTLGMFVAAALIPMSAHADTTPRFAMSVGTDIGKHEHPDDSGATVGVNVDAQVRASIFTLGASAGYDDYAPMNGVPVHASSIVTHAGLAVPLAKSSPSAGKRMVQLDAIGSYELGRHYFSPEGSRSEFLGPDTSYAGTDATINFSGIRAGGALTVHRAGASNSVVVKLEVIGRRDFRQANLQYDATSCGGLFRSDSDCDTEHDTTRVGGTEMAVATSVGVLFGE